MTTAPPVAPRSRDPVAESPQPSSCSSSGSEAGTLVYGLVTADAQTVELELGDGTRSIVEPVTVEGWDRRVVATWLPPQTSAGQRRRSRLPMAGSSLGSPCSWRRNRSCPTDGTSVP